MKTKGNHKSAPRQSRSLPPVSIGRQLGVYVPPPVEKPREVGERIQALKSRDIAKNWTSTVPRIGVTVEPEAITVVDRPAHTVPRIGVTEDVQRTQDYHRWFIATDPSAQMVRNFILSFVILGGLRWRSEYEDYDRETGEIFTVEARWEDHGIGHTFELDGFGSYDEDEDEKARRYVSESIFREAYGEELFCEHGRTWKERCAHCELLDRGISSSRLEGLLDPANAQDVKPKKGGNTALANQLLSKIGLGKWAGTAKEESYGGGNNEIAAIDAAGQRQALLGGKRIKPKGIGADSDAAHGEDKTGGSQDNSREGEYIGKRSLARLGMTEKQIVADYCKQLNEEAAEQLRAFESEGNPTRKEVSAHRKKLKAEREDLLRVFVESRKQGTAIDAEKMAVTRSLHDDAAAAAGVILGTGDTRSLPKTGEKLLDSQKVSAETHDGEHPIESQIELAQDEINDDDGDGDGNQV
jgi:hypothetical protein